MGQQKTPPMIVMGYSKVVVKCRCKDKVELRKICWLSKKIDLDGYVFASRSSIKDVDCAFHEVLNMHIRFVQCHETRLHFLK